MWVGKDDEGQKSNDSPSKMKTAGSEKFSSHNFQEVIVLYQLATVEDTKSSVGSSPGVFV